MKLAAVIVLLALAGCGTQHAHEIIPDSAAAIAAATELCHWDGSLHLHAELQGEKWHVSDESGQNQAFLNRYDSGSGTYICVGL